MNSPGPRLATLLVILSFGACTGNGPVAASGTPLAAPPPPAAAPLAEVPARPEVASLDPILFAADASSGCRLAQDREFVYWTDEGGGAVRRRAKRGGETLILARDQGEPAGLAVDASYVFWAVQGPGRIRRAPVAGGAFGGLAADQDTPWDVALDDGFVYWTNAGFHDEPSGDAVMRAPRGGGPVTVVAKEPSGSQPRALALAGDHVYWATTYPYKTGTIKRAPRSGGAGVTLAEAQVSPHALALDASFVYFTNSGLKQDGSVVKVPRDGGPTVQLFQGEGGAPYAIALDETSVYFTDSWGGVFRVPKAGGAARRLATIPGGGGSADAIAVDADALWICGDRGVWRLGWTAGPPPEVLTAPGGKSASHVAYHGEGELLAAGEDVLLHDLTTGQVKRTFEVSEWIRGMAVVADGQALVVADRDGTVRRWDIGSGALTWRFEPDRSESADVRGFAASADGARVVVSDARDVVRVLDGAAGKEVRRLVGPTADIRAIALLPDGRRALTGAELDRFGPRPPPEEQPPLRLWDLETGEALAALLDTPEAVWTIAVTGDGKRAVTGGEGALLRVWDVDAARVLATHKATGLIREIALLRAGLRAVVLSEGDGVCLWDLEAGTRLACTTAGSRDMYHVALAPSEKEVFYAQGSVFRRWQLP